MRRSSILMLLMSLVVSSAGAQSRCVDIFRSDLPNPSTDARELYQITHDLMNQGLRKNLPQLQKTLKDLRFRAAPMERLITGMIGDRFSTLDGPEADAIRPQITETLQLQRAAATLGEHADFYDVQTWIRERSVEKIVVAAVRDGDLRSFRALIEDPIFPPSRWAPALFKLESATHEHWMDFLFQKAPALNDVQKLRLATLLGRIHSREARHLLHELSQELRQAITDPKKITPEQHDLETTLSVAISNQN